MHTPYRCNHCRRRFTLRRPREEYKREPRCPHCRSGSYHFDADEARKRERKACYCDGYWFPHRRGSLQCRHYAGPRDLELEADFEVLETIGNAAVVPF